MSAHIWPRFREWLGWVLAVSRGVQRRCVHDSLATAPQAVTRRRALRPPAAACGDVRGKAGGGMGTRRARRVLWGQGS